MSARPLPSLPTETHSHILSFCDAQTLGRAAQVSLAFLELASPVLYGEITIKGYAQLKRLFYDETHTSSAPHLDRFLSLDQTRTFTFVGLPEDRDLTMFNGHEDEAREWCKQADRYFLPRRLGTSFPLSIHTLCTRFHPADRVKPYPGDQAEKLATRVLQLFNPEYAYLASSCASAKVFTLSDDVKWTRLRTLSLDEIDYQRPLYAASHIKMGRSLTCILELDKTEDVRERMTNCVVEHMTEDLGAYCQLVEILKEIVLRVRSQAEGDREAERLRDGVGQEAELGEDKEDHYVMPSIRCEIV